MNILNKKMKSKRSIVIKRLSYFFVFVSIFSIWLISYNYYPDTQTFNERGDSFGALNTLFSGFAFAGVLVALFLQREELSLQREEMKELTDANNKQAEILAESQRRELERYRLQIMPLIIHDKTIGPPRNIDGRYKHTLINEGEIIYDVWVTYTSPVEKATKYVCLAKTWPNGDVQTLTLPAIESNFRYNIYIHFKNILGEDHKLLMDIEKHKILAFGFNVNELGFKMSTSPNGSRVAYPGQSFIST
jgi:hypothetical protein